MLAGPGQALDPNPGALMLNDLYRDPQQVPGLRIHWLDLVKVLYVVMGDFGFYGTFKIFKDLL